jgi:hypothetical protein
MELKKAVHLHDPVHLRGDGAAYSLPKTPRTGALTNHRIGEMPAMHGAHIGSAVRNHRVAKAPTVHDA